MSFEQDLQIDWRELREAGSEPPASLLMETGSHSSWSSFLRTVTFQNYISVYNYCTLNTNLPTIVLKCTLVVTRGVYMPILPIYIPVCRN